MDYLQFVDFANKQDSRNVFAEYKQNLDLSLPDKVKAFYKKFNPLDVEIDDSGLGIRFFPVDDLPNLQRDYSYLKDAFIFATCNGDPIFLNNGRVFTCAHGVKESKPELLANSFDEYLSKLMNHGVSDAV
jgi:hypothetical protein